MVGLNRLLSFLPWLVVFEGVSMLIGTSASPNKGNPQIHDWYHALVKSPLNPPPFVFPLAWTILYGLIAFSLWRVWRLDQMRKTSFWALALGHMILNWSWSYVFFVGQNIKVAELWLGAVFLSAIALTIWIRRFDRTAAFALLPYLGWLVFALYLNGYIVWAN